MRGAGLYRNGTCLATGRVLDERELERVLGDQRGRVTEALEAFAENTMRYLREEGKLLAEGIDFPPLDDTLPRPACARRRARARVQARPAHGQPVHPRLQAGPDRRRRRRRRAARGGLQAGRDRRRHGFGLRQRAAVRRRAARPRLPRRTGTWRAARTAARRAVPDRPRDRNQRGPRAAARVREGLGADRRRRHALQPDRVPRAQSRRDVVDVHHAPEGGGDPDRRERRLPAREPPGRDLAARPARARRSRARSPSRSSSRRRCAT